MLYVEDNKQIDTISVGYIQSDGNSQNQKIIDQRIETLKMEIRGLLLSDDCVDFDELMETIDHRHKLELEKAYQRGIRHGAYFQKAILTGEADK